MQRAARWIITLLTAITCLACATTAGTPAPAAAPPTTTAAPGALTFPPRPRDIPIRDIDPCSLLTPDQRAELKLDTPPRNFTGVNGRLGATHDCTILGFGTPNIAVGIALAYEAGMQRVTANDEDAMEQITIDGFPAAIFRNPDFTDVCGLFIDIAPGQVILLQFRDGGLQTPIPREELCRSVHEVGHKVMRTLLTR